MHIHTKRVFVLKINKSIFIALSSSEFQLRYSLLKDACSAHYTIVYRRYGAAIGQPKRAEKLYPIDTDRC